MTDETQAVQAPETEPSPPAVEQPKEEVAVTEEPPKAEPDPTPPLAPSDLSIPEGRQVDDGLLKKFVDTLNNTSLSPADKANALIGLQKEAMAAAEEAQTQAFASMNEEWISQIKSDPELGGDKLDDNLAVVAKVIDKYGDQELRDALALTGAGNHPAVFRFMLKVAQDVTEGGPVTGASSSKQPDLASLLYDKT